MSWSGGHNYMDLDVLLSLLRLGSSWSILIGFTLLRENRGSHSHHCWLASVGFIIHCLHPSITFQFCFQPDWLLDLWHGGPFSLLKPLLDKPPCLYCVSTLSWWQNLPSVSWIVCLNHSGRLSRCLALCRTPPSRLRCFWLNLKAHVLLILEMFICAHGKWKC